MSGEGYRGTPQGLKSEMSDNQVTVEGYDFNRGVNYEALLTSYRSVGFQATNFGLAIDEINKMRSWRLSDEPYDDAREADELRSPEVRANVKCTIFLSYTSNLISSGLREIIRFLVQHKLVSCLVTTAGGIEEDFIKCLSPMFIGDFTLKGKDLRLRGLNRTGNLVVPNDNYCVFEEWLQPILNSMADEQVSTGKVWTPSQMIHRLGKEIDNESSVYYWAYKNNIPVFCPAITDGSIGDMLYFHTYARDSGTALVLDVVGDM